MCPQQFARSPACPCRVPRDSTVVALEPLKRSEVNSFRDTSNRPMRAAIYARVSTLEQEPENQLKELRTHCELRGWTVREYVDKGVSGAKDRRPALDELLRDAKRRRFDVLVCWRLDRLGR